MSALWERLGDGCISVEDDFEISAALPRSEHRSNIDTRHDYKSSIPKGRGRVFFFRN